MNPEEKLRSLELTLPSVPSPGGNYLTHRRVGSLLYFSGVISISSDGTEWIGKVGAERSLQDGYEAAQVCALNVLATLKEVTGSLDSIKQFVYLGGYVNAVSGYGKSPSVVNGASDLFEAVYGDVGKHARAAVAVAGLPMNATVEIQVTVELI